MTPVQRRVILTLVFLICWAVAGLAYVSYQRAKGYPLPPAAQPVSCLRVDGLQFEGAVDSYLGDNMRFEVATGGMVVVSGTWVVTSGPCDGAR